MDINTDIGNNDLTLEVSLEEQIIISRDYNSLINKPSINGQELIGNYDEQDPTIAQISDEDINSIIDEVFD